MTTPPRASAVPSASLVADLCRELWRLRNRATQVVDALRRSRNPGLRGRLQRELVGLQRRRQQVRELIAALPRPTGEGPMLMRALLVELCRRPLAQL